MAAQGGVQVERVSFIGPPFLGLMVCLRINNVIIPHGVRQKSVSNVGGR